MGAIHSYLFLFFPPHWVVCRKPSEAEKGEEKEEREGKKGDNVLGGIEKKEGLKGPSGLSRAAILHFPVFSPGVFVGIMSPAAGGRLGIHKHHKANNAFLSS